MASANLLLAPVLDNRPGASLTLRRKLVDSCTAKLHGAVISGRRYWVKAMARRDKVKTAYACEGQKTKSLKLEE
jgi:hypothetical protein